MKITFDNSARIAGIGLVPWTRLGPERWFKNYRIASLYGWDLGQATDAPTVCAVADHAALPPMAKLNSQHLIETQAFQRLATEHLPGYDFLTYRPVEVPAQLRQAGTRFLGMNQRLTTTLENKAEFRLRFADLKLPFPAYRIISRADVQLDKAGLRQLLAGREQVIVQDESLGGGRGTFIVRELADLKHALTTIAALDGGQRLIISDMISGAYERSVQGVVTRFGTFVGPLQKQIIAHPLLANVQTTDGDRFCGGEISAQDTCQLMYPEIRSWALKVGERLGQLGYRGVFSLDCLISQNGHVYTLEINPRLTGMTPLLTALYREEQDIPFYLLHILELAGMKYTITDAGLSDTPPQGGLLVLHSPEPHAVRITAAPDSGLYKLTDMSFVARQYRLDSARLGGQMLVQQYTPPGFRIKPGGRLMTLLTHDVLTDERDRLLPSTVNTVQHLLNNVKLKEVRA